MQSQAWRKATKAFLGKHPFCEWIVEHATKDTCRKPAYIVDHIVPRTRGGADKSSNWQALCVPHHGIKSAIEAGRLPTAVAHPDNLRLDQWHAWKRKPDAVNERG